MYTGINFFKKYFILLVQVTDGTEYNVWLHLMSKPLCPLCAFAAKSEKLTGFLCLGNVIHILFIIIISRGLYEDNLLLIHW